jgi:hypothetical protein
VGCGAPTYREAPVYGSTKVDAGAEAGTEFAELWYLDDPVETVKIYVWKLLHKHTRVWIDVFVTASTNVNTCSVLFDEAYNLVHVREGKIIDLQESLSRGEGIFYITANVRKQKAVYQRNVPVTL